MLDWDQGLKSESVKPIGDYMELLNTQNMQSGMWEGCWDGDTTH